MTHITHMPVNDLDTRESCRLICGCPFYYRVKGGLKATVTNWMRPDISERIATVLIEWGFLREDPLSKGYYCIDLRRTDKTFEEHYGFED